ncbi:hypothetical protein [Desulfobacca acetoxidans]|uniref:Putative cytoplasmic protein n=1 Tax=Desulfobacca acetoxidans (strain ATCC 700848 / DSM 11109 / ASRB2) TaxID=880072 RepID=F2NF10_DESAR|nr:hypothetical protein [Desulfobacca acetoxidans]AEB08350.1 putative cytoplasmic protein [Desulfobacca acetoxidans DSM 11109]HAY23318.1 hypothetical protein [Desulfobacterales bacterium]
MIQKTVEDLAATVLSLDEDGLAKQLKHYKKIMEDFSPTPEWEKAVIAFFLINGVRVKNNLMDAQSRRNNLFQFSQPDPHRQQTRLRVVK